MSYNDLIQLYFDRSNALQWYWTLYVVIAGGLLAFSSLRKSPDTVTTVLVLVLFSFFAYKNLGAIAETSVQRFAALDAIRAYKLPEMGAVESGKARELIEPTLVPPPLPGVKQFHVTSSVLVVAAIGAMEWRRRRDAAKQN